IAFATDAASSDWLVRRRSDRAILIRTSESTQEGKLTNRTVDRETKRHDVFDLGPIRADEEMLPVWKEKLSRIARAQNLLRVVEKASHIPRNDDDTPPSVKVEILRRGKADQDWKAAEGTARRFFPNDKARFQISPVNFVIDVTVLYVDSGFGIEPLFPNRGDLNRLKPGERPRTFSVDVNGDT